MTIQRWVKLMKKGCTWILLFLLFTLSACAGVESEVKKGWKNEFNTLRIVDLTAQDNKLLDAGSHLQDSLEDSLDNTGFLLTGNEARFFLKYKVLEFKEGNRLARMATFGAASSAKAKLKVKAALYNENEMVGGWVVTSWLNGGITGGSSEKLFHQAAAKIADHLKGDY